MKWESSEDQFLRDHYCNLGGSRCGYVLGRSESSVYKRALRLGLTDSERDRSWNDEQYLCALKNKDIQYRPLEVYKCTRTPIKHKCNMCNAEFLAEPRKILSLEKKCSCQNKTNNFDKTKPAWLYFVSFVYQDHTYYKIGITNRSVKRRYGSQWKALQMTLIWQKEFEKGEDALNLEKLILSKYKQYKVNPNCLKAGNTEVLSTIVHEEECNFK